MAESQAPEVPLSWFLINSPSIEGQQVESLRPIFCIITGQAVDKAFSVRAERIHFHRLNWKETVENKYKDHDN